MADQFVCEAFGGLKGSLGDFWLMLQHAKILDPYKKKPYKIESQKSF